MTDSVPAWKKLGYGGRWGYCLAGRWHVQQPGIASHWQIWDSDKKEWIPKAFKTAAEAKAIAEWLAAKPGRLFHEYEQGALF